MEIKGVAKNTEIVQCKNVTGHQSPTYYRFDLLDAKAMFAIAENVAKGAEKYGEDDWRGIPIQDNINKALIHIYADLAGDTQDDHLTHAATRLIFALALRLAEEEGHSKCASTIQDVKEVMK